MHTHTWEDLETIAVALPNIHASINRVMRCLQGSREAVMQGQLQALSFVTPERVALLQDIDACVRDWMEKNNLTEIIRQMPVVLLPF